VIDHVTIRVQDLAEGQRFYASALELLDHSGAAVTGGGFVDWGDFSITEASGERPVTRRAHLAFYAPSRQAVDGWWRALTDAGYEDAGAPGPRPRYGPEYYGGFVLDRAGNSIEAVNNGARRQPGVIDHLWLRTRSLEDATRFYAVVCPAVEHVVERHDRRTQIRGSGATFSIVEGTPTESLHLAFAARDRQAVGAFHEAGVDAGFASRGAPGERPTYHVGYYGAFLADPDGNTIEAVFHGR